MIDFLFFILSIATYRCQHKEIKGRIISDPAFLLALKRHTSFLHMMILKRFDVIRRMAFLTFHDIETDSLAFA
jgi:hypothetical protein